MAGSMKDIKLRIKSVESTMQITKAMELVASSKMRRAKERVERSRPYFEVLYGALTDIAAADIELPCKSGRSGGRCSSSSRATGGWPAGTIPTSSSWRKPSPAK